MKKQITHNCQDETIEAKARWFQSLSIQERVELLDMYTAMILEMNPKIADQKRVYPTNGRVRVVKPT
jgi:hypothetical protein